MQMSRVGWPTSGGLVLLSLLAVATPLLWPGIPPLIDLPGHMAGYAIELDVDQSQELQRYFKFRWQLLGNLGLELLMVPLGRVFGVEIGAKIATLIIPLITAAGFLAIAKQVHGRIPLTAFAAVPIALNYWLMYGFVNYCLAAGLAMLSLAFWINLTVSSRWRARTAAFVVISILIWLCHAVGWIMLGAVCGAYELQRRVYSGEGIWRSIGMTVISCVPLLAPVAIILAFPTGDGLAMSGWFNLPDMARSVASILRDRWLVVDVVATLFLFVLLLAAMFRLWGLRLEPKLVWPAVALLATFVLAPTSINGSYFVDGRIFPYAVALLILSINGDPADQRARILGVASVVFMLLKLGSNVVSLAMYDHSYREQLEVMQHIPRGAAVMTLQRVPCETGLAAWFNPRLYNLPGMAVVRNHAFVNTTFAVPGLHLLSTHFPQAGPFQLSGSGNVTIGENCRQGFGRPIDEVVSEIPMDAFDQVWLLDVPRANWPQDKQLELIWWREESALFQIVRD